MDPNTRLILGAITLLSIQVIVGGSAVFFLRRRYQIDPTWSLPKSMGAYFVLGLIVGFIGIIPLVGPILAIIVSLVGLKRISGLEIIPAIILTFVLGIFVFAVAAVISNQLQIDLLSIRNPREI